MICETSLVSVEDIKVKRADVPQPVTYSNGAMASVAELVLADRNRSFWRGQISEILASLGGRTVRPSCATALSRRFTQIDGPAKSRAPGHEVNSGGHDGYLHDRRDCRLTQLAPRGMDESSGDGTRWEAAALR